MLDVHHNSISELEKFIDEVDNNNPILKQIVKNLRFFSQKGGNIESDQKLKNIKELNTNIKEIEHEKKLIEYIQTDELIIVIRDLLIDKDSNLRKEACKCLKRLINKSTVMIDMYKDYKIHFLISRNIEKELKTKNSTIKSVEVMECKHYILI